MQLGGAHSRGRLPRLTSVCASGAKVWLRAAASPSWRRGNLVLQHLGRAVPTHSALSTGSAPRRTYPDASSSSLGFRLWWGLDGGEDPWAIEWGEYAFPPPGLPFSLGSGDRPHATQWGPLHAAAIPGSSTCSTGHLFPLGDTTDPSCKLIMNAESFTGTAPCLG